MAYYTVWLANGQRFHVYARSSLDAARLLLNYHGGELYIKIVRIEYIRSVQERPPHRHWVHKLRRYG